MNHHHHPAPADHNRAFAIGVVLNVAFVLVEAGYGVFADSLALVADAGHNLSDVASLLLAWGASRIAARAATERRTYGFRKATVMASLASAVLLLAVLGGIAWEAVGRFLEPSPVAGWTVVSVAGIGVVVNTATALLFVRGQKDDLNVRGAFLHMAADAAVSLGVVLAGGLMLWQGWLWVDPVISLLIVVVVFIGTWGLLRESADYAMDAVPRRIDLAAVRDYLRGLEGVERVHDLHVWPLSTTEIALTVHLVVDHQEIDNSFLHRVQRELHDRFGIAHATMQIESSKGEDGCLLAGPGPS